MLAACSLSRTTLKHNSLQPPAFLESPGVLGHPAVVKWQKKLSRLKYTVFPSWQLIKQLMYSISTGRPCVGICSEGCDLERSLPEKTTYFIFRKSEMCFGMRGVLKVVMATVEWRSLLSCTCVWLVSQKENSAVLLHPSLITLNHAVEMADEWTVTVDVGSG